MYLVGKNQLLCNGMTKWKIAFSTIGLVTLTLWLAVLSYPGEKLQIIACDVGQGDAVLVQKGSDQILFDGGPDASVMSCLSNYMPFWDRTIEMVVLSHQQKDHFGGLIEVFKRYNVQNLIATPISASSQDYKVLIKLVGGSDVRVINPIGGITMRLGLIYLDILHPSEDFLAINTDIDFAPKDKNVLGAYTTSADLNDFSVVVHLRYENFDALFTGDIGPRIIDEILLTSGVEDVEYIKIPHHGSKNGITEDLLDATKPKVAVISVKKDNSYGHPHKEVLDMLDERSIKVYRTDEMGDVEIMSDGERD